MAVTAAIQLSWLGRRGLREVALRCARATRYTREALVCDRRRPAADARRRCCASSPSRRRSAPEKLIDRLVEEGYLAGVPIRAGFEASAYDGGLLVAATERRTRAEIDGFAAAFEKAVR